MKSCDCIIGIIWNLDHVEDMTVNSYVKKIEQAIDDSKSNAEFFNEWLQKGQKYRVYKPEDYLDRRRGLTRLFNYCPNCGTQNDFKMLRKRLKE